MARIQFTLCGSYSSEEELNPYKITEAPVRQEILSLINLEPQTLGKLAVKLGLEEEELADHIKALGRAGLIEEIGGRYKPSFAIFTTQDQERLKPLIEKVSGSIAQVIQRNRDMVHATHEACRFPAHGFSFNDIAYILIMAYTFDYGGLEMLSKAGFLTISKEMPGGKYIFSGLEGELDLRSAWRWGHSSRFGRFTFFGHGELPRVGPRKAFPELAYLWLFKEAQPETVVTQRMEEIGKILLALYERPMELEALTDQTGLEQGRITEHLALLQELEYVRMERKAFFSACPVVDEKALEQIRAMIEALWGEIISLVIQSNWQRLEQLYQETAPAWNGIDLEEAFNPIYHMIFERAARMLMEQGIVPWPRRHSDGARYAVWVQLGECWT
jgi:DNA-binding transcriptional ArsR family regulator